MLVHLRTQQARLRAKTPPTTKPKAPAAPPPSQPPLSELASLKAELVALQTKFEEFKHSYESSSSEASSSSLPQSPRTNPTVVPAHPPSPSPSSSASMAQECTAHHEHCWLQPILDSIYCPALFHHIDSSMVPIYTFAMPNDVQCILMVMWQHPVTWASTLMETCM
ncbi:hypothetical protein SCLCIDRAFT_26787 [Scleroderma citrinum Foug A]|uniref:Uncharacterized protein n=1 Tax=Scleroderma citrinum Foug A TaxID=1036808 RepID=A0A0C3A609_9AGAM|nr:hypothetical protein SCLCIDRAFT_26787 [Scleroderma citrinum Foug A]